tara:strand:- start:1167 stop:1760 length:594 start_codon:yes stop_codon:yes gene_type:complete
MTNSNVHSIFFISLLKKGDEKAYETLFRLYYDKLLHISKGYLGTMEDAEEIVQNVFLKVWEQKNNFEKINNINNYLYTMTKNACLDQIKHRKVKSLYSQNRYKENIEDQCHFIKDEAASLLLENELKKRIEFSIELLPEKCKNVFIKSRIEGMNHKEIAKIFNLSKRTVDNHIYNALKHMKFHLKDFLSFILYFLFF